MFLDKIADAFRRVEQIRIGESFALPPGTVIVIGNNPPREMRNFRPKRANVIFGEGGKLGDHTVTLAHLSKEGSKGNIVVERPTTNSTEAIVVYDPQADLTLMLKPGEHYIFQDAPNVNLLIRSNGHVWRIVVKETDRFIISEGEARK